MGDVQTEDESGSIWTRINALGGECFVIPNSQGCRIYEMNPRATRLQKIARHRAIKWLKATKSDYRVWWSDWDCSGGDTFVHIEASDRRALFKLQFVTGPTVDYRFD